MTTNIDLIAQRPPDLASSPPDERIDRNIIHVIDRLFEMYAPKAEPPDDMMPRSIECNLILSGGMLISGALRETRYIGIYSLLSLGKNQKTGAPTMVEQFISYKSILSVMVERADLLRARPGSTIITSGS